MSPGRLLLMVFGALGAGLVSSITGGTSLVTVPLLLLAGVEPQSAIGTNMLVVAALSAGSAARFQVAKAVPCNPTLILALAAIPGSLAGALATVWLDERTLRLIISTALLAMAALLTIHPTFGAARAKTGPRLRSLGYFVLSLWAIYGGMFSGGYATLLTFGVVFFFGCTLPEAIAASKVINFVGSAAASVVFITRGLVRWDLAVCMGIAAALGGWIGAKLALRSRPEQIRRLFALLLGAIGAKVGYDACRTSRSS